jgi:hypothetical protein
LRFGSPVSYKSKQINPICKGLIVLIDVDMMLRAEQSQNQQPFVFEQLEILLAQLHSSASRILERL